MCKYGEETSTPGPVRGTENLTVRTRHSPATPTYHLKEEGRILEEDSSFDPVPVSLSNQSRTTSSPLEGGMYPGPTFFPRDMES